MPSFSAAEPTLRDPLCSQPGLDHVGHFPGLVFEFLQQLHVVGVVGPAGTKQDVVGLISPGLEPVGPGRDSPIDEAFKPQKVVAGELHGEKFSNRAAELAVRLSTGAVSGSDAQAILGSFSLAENEQCVVFDETFTGEPGGERSSPLQYAHIAVSNNPSL